MLDDAAELLGGAGQEAGHVLERDERDVEAVAEAHEARALDRGVDVEAAGQVRGLVGDDADGRPPRRAKPTTMLGAKSAWTSKNCRRRPRRRTTSLMS